MNVTTVRAEAPITGIEVRLTLQEGVDIRDALDDFKQLGGDAGWKTIWEFGRRVAAALQTGGR